MMLSKVSILAMLAATAVASAIPAGEPGAVSARQEEWNIWYVPHRIITRYF